MNTASNEIKSRIIAKTQVLDGYIGIPLEATFIFDNEKFTLKGGFGGTPIMIYVINTGVLRIGTASDEEIIEGMLSRGMAVCVLDYLNNELAAGNKLHYSVQSVRSLIMKGELFDSVPEFPKGDYPETLVVPSGYDVSFGNVYWEFDKHGAEGTIEKIIEIWNNDFRGTKSERLIKWTDAFGNRKTVAAAFDGSLPVWYDKDGGESPDGEYTKVKYAVANAITDCVKPDGAPLDLKLYMHIVYPTRPNKRVPVMCLSSSVENLCKGSSAEDRPHLNGFLFEGYAGVLFDYGYTPMARSDHYGYFDGFPKPGYVTGDNPTYSMKFYNDFSDNAAMRYIRYLSESEPDKFRFDGENIGVYGNSKGSWMTFLGEADPTAMTPRRVMKGESGKTRYEANKPGIDGINPPEEQPWLRCNGKELFGGAKLVYSGCGGTTFAISRKHGPMFVSCNRMDSSCFGTSNAMVNLGRIYDIPTMWLEVPLPHTITYGNDLFYGADSYQAFLDFCGYYLKGDAVKVVGARVNKHTFPSSVTVLFSGAVPEIGENMVTLTSEDGKRIELKSRSAYGGLEWTFEPSEPFFGAGYRLYIDENVSGDNGKTIGKAYELEIDFGAGAKINPEEKSIIVDNSCNKLAVAFEVTNDGVNTVGAYNGKGELLGSVNTSKKGWYRIELSRSAIESSDITLRTMRAVGNKVTYHPVTPTGCESAERDFIDGNTPALKITGAKLCTKFPTEEFYSYPAGVAVCQDLIKDTPLDDSDIGRRFKLSFKVYDTASRYLCFGLNHCSSRESAIADYYRVMGNELTRPDTVTEVNLDYTVYEPMYGEIGKHKKQLNFSMFGRGCEDTPIYISDIRCEELVTEVEIGKRFVISYNDDGLLPFGKSDIACPKSPWEKK